MSISGEDALTIDRKYRDHWTGQLPTRFVILTNEVPRLADSSGALASRFIVLVLTRSFLGREDVTLTDALLAEATGIFNWALDGRDRLQARGYFKQPESGDQMVTALADLGSPIAAFVNERCDLAPTHSISVDVLYRAWREWCIGQGDEPTDVRVFGRDLVAACPGVRKERPSDDGKRVYKYAGIRLAERNNDAWS